MKVAFLHNAIPVYRADLFNLILSNHRNLEILICPVKNAQVVALASSERVDVLTCMYVPFSHAIAWPVGLYRRLRKGHYNIVIANDVSLVSTWIAFIYARRTGAEFILWTEERLWPSQPRRRILRGWEKLIIHRANHILAFGSRVGDFLAAQGVGKDRIHLVLNEPGRPTYSEAIVREKARGLLQDLPRTSYNFLFLGRLVTRKGVHFLLQAFSSLITSGYDVALVIAGDGPERAKLEGQAMALLGEYASRVRFVGQVADNDKEAVFRVAHALVYPSIVTSRSSLEAWGLAVNEALTHKLPVIASECVGASELIGAQNGVVVRSGDWPQLADAMKRFVELKLSVVDGRYGSNLQSVESVLGGLIRGDQE